MNIIYGNIAKYKSVNILIFQELVRHFHKIIVKLSILQLPKPIQAYFSNKMRRVDLLISTKIGGHSIPKSCDNSSHCPNAIIL